MSHILLLGAGFSRNWGGLLSVEAFEYLLGCPEIVENNFLKEALWRHQGKGGFEDALADTYRGYIREPQKHTKDYQALLAAIARMFDDMNSSFRKVPSLMSSQSVGNSIGKFMARFDAIFSLNLDLLLEYKYASAVPSLVDSPRRWGGCQFPGMKLTTNDSSDFGGQWMPLPSEEFRIDENLQPIFKLHGSSNWHANHGGPLLVLGSSKSQDIGASPVLLKYQQEFEARLFQAGAKLMVIGYGFRDGHINDTIIRAIEEAGLRMFIIAPEGAALAREINPLDRAIIFQGTRLEDAFKKGLVGASRRPLLSTFGEDETELSKLKRFFD